MAEEEMSISPICVGWSSESHLCCMMMRQKTCRLAPNHTSSENSPKVEM